jgi:transcriptional regulator with XRE-family HTH domain
MSLSDADIDHRIAARIRELRAERGLTLEGLAGLAEVSRSMLSRVERGESSPTAQLLGKICNGLGITLSVLFAPTQAPASPLARHADQPTWRDPGTGYLRRTVSPAGTGSPVDIAEVVFPAHASIAFDSQRLVGGADQHVWVLDGTLELVVGEETFRLQRGDCLMTRFDSPVVFRNPTARPVRYAVIVTRAGTRP